MTVTALGTITTSTFTLFITGEPGVFAYDDIEANNQTFIITATPSFTNISTSGTVTSWAISPMYQADFRLAPATVAFGAHRRLNKSRQVIPYGLTTRQVRPQPPSTSRLVQRYPATSSTSQKTTSGRKFLRQHRSFFHQHHDRKWLYLGSSQYQQRFSQQQCWSIHDYIHR